MKLIISKSNIQKQGRIELTTGMIGKTVDIEFAPDWNGYTKVAVFRNFIDGETPIIKENPATPLEIPPEVLRKEDARCYVGFYGYKIESGIKTEATPTIYTDIAIVKLGATTDGNPGMDIPPTVADQLINDVNVLNNRVDDAEDNIDDLAERMQDAESELADHEERIDALEQGGGGGGGAVSSVNGKTGAVVLNAEDVGALPDDTAIPTKTSDLTNDSGFIGEDDTEEAEVVALASVATSGKYGDLISKPTTLTSIPVDLTAEYTSENGYVATGSISIGQTVDLTNRTESAKYWFVCIPCEEDDVFELVGKGANAPRLWTFLDSEYKLLSKAASGATELDGVELTATQDGYFLSCIDHAYDYSLIVRRQNNKIEQLNYESLPEVAKEVIEEYISEKTGSIYDRKELIFGSVPASWYKCQSTQTSSLVKTSTYAELISEFDTVVTADPLYVTKSQVGTGGDGQAIYMYTFKAPELTSASSPSIKNMKRKPKIICVAGNHPNEKGIIYGWLEFAKDLVNNWSESEALYYLRNSVEILLIPCVNPYGFDNNVEVTITGANPNYNYDYNWSRYGEDSEDDGGTSAFSEPETQAVRDVVLANKDAMLFCDYHSYGATNVSKLTNVNWLTFHPITEIDDVIYNQVIHEVKTHIANLTLHFEKEFGIARTSEYPVFGHATTTTHRGASKSWAMEQGIIANTCEGFCGFPLDSGADTTLYNSDVKKANAEIVGNWMMTVLRTYAVRRGD